MISRRELIEEVVASSDLFHTDEEITQQEQEEIDNFIDELETAFTQYVEYLIGPETTSNHFWQHEFNYGYNHCIKGIRQRAKL